MKILQLSKFFPPFWGGIETAVFEMAEALNSHVGITCEVLCCNTKLKNEEEFYNGKYKVMRAASFGRLFSTSISPAIVIKLFKIRNDYDIIHVHFPDPITGLALFLSRPKCKVIIHWHSDIIKQKYLLKLYLPIQNWLLRRSDLIIGTSPKYIAESPQLAKFTYKCVSIPTGVTINPEWIEAEKVNKIKESYTGKQILFSLGRLVYYKGFEYLIEAAAKLPNSYVILIGGVGPLENSLRQKIEQLGLNEKVILLGRISQQDLPSYFAAAELFVFPSIEKSEALGAAQIEAMGYGKPIVATDIPMSGVSWVNAHMISGINVERKNAVALANGILKIMNDQALLKQLSLGSLNRYQELFTSSKMNELVKKSYLKLLPENSIKSDEEVPKVSIITVLLDNVKYIEDAIHSVLNQDYPNIEYIIIDGGSSDGSKEIVERYRHKLNVFISEPDSGVYFALNKGLGLATGDIVGFLHSDDLLIGKDAIGKIVGAFNKSDNIDAVYGNLFYIKPNNIQAITRVWHAGKYYGDSFYKGWMPPHPTFYVRSEVYQKFGSFNTQLKFAADYELMLRFILKHQITLSYIPEFLVKMRVGGASNRNLSNRIKANIEDRKAWKLVEIKPGLLTLVLKPLKKIFQYSIFNKSWNNHQ